MSVDTLEQMAEQVARLTPADLEKLLHLVTERLAERYRSEFEALAVRFIEEHRDLMEELAKR